MSIINSILKYLLVINQPTILKLFSLLLTKLNLLKVLYNNFQNDELRAKTIFFKEKIKEARAEKDAKIEQLKAEAEVTVDIDAREKHLC